MRTTFGPVIFGAGHRPKLPEGWEAIEKEDDWLFAKDESGRLHFVGENLAYPASIATEEDAFRTQGRLRAGQVFLSEGDPIELPQP